MTGVDGAAGVAGLRLGARVGGEGDTGDTVLECGRTNTGAELRHLRLLFCAHNPRTNTSLATLLCDSQRGTDGTERKRRRTVSGDGHAVTDGSFVPAPERDFRSVKIMDVRFKLSTILLNLYFWRQRKM